MTRRLLISLFVVIGLIIGGCAKDSEPNAVELTQDTVILDVRTGVEFAAGHLENAELRDLNNGDFAASLPVLDPDATYFVYCRSGNRSAQAVAMMRDAGFKDVTDLGSMQNASKTTGIPIVK